MILSSPPYCTRIDYAIATLPELATIGISGDQFRILREEMIGTATICTHNIQPTDSWGRRCNNLLQKIRRHPSKASGSYYYRNHLQYFASMYESLAECRRVSKPGGTCVLVVQDSFYKDQHNDLPGIITEMAKGNGFNLYKRFDFKQSQTLAGVNPAVRDYRTTFTATESVLCFNAIN
jgi:hypothetical protein